MRFTIFSLRPTTTPSPPHHHLHHLRTLFSGTFTLVRDRGLDHAVEREKNLKPLLTLRTLINNEPSKSLPISIIKQSLNLPFRPIDFIRKYPSIFQEFYPPTTTTTFTEPLIKLTSEAVNLNIDEEFMFASDVFKKDVADRVLKLLMIAKGNKIPLSVVDCLKWDLGLPEDYVKSVIPEFPDYFRVVGDGVNADLELICWSKEHAVSFLEKKHGSKAKGLCFPVQFSTGFEMDKKYEKWLKEWNNLKYVSPYENGVNLSGSSEESDKWVVGVLHEILNLLVSKKTEKDNVLMIGEWLGLASRFKRVLLQHPGIFYVSSKNRTYTVVLREGYKRGLLVEDNPAMEFRRRYIHLMNTVKEDGKKDKAEKVKTSTKEGNVKEDEGKVGEEERDENHGEEEEEGSSEELSDDEDEDASEAVDDDDEEESSRDTRKSSANRRGRNFAETNSSNRRGKNFEESNSANRRGRNSEESNSTNRRGRNFDESNSPNRRGRNFDESNSPNRRGRNFDESNSTNRRGRNFDESNSANRRGRNSEESNSTNRRGRNFDESCSTNRRGRNFEESNSANRRGRNSVEVKLDTEKPSRDSHRERSDGKVMRSSWEKNASEVSKRMQMRDEHKDGKISPQRSRSSKSREGLLTIKKTVV